MQQNFGLDVSISPPYVLLLLNSFDVPRCSRRFYIDKITNKKYGSKYLNIKSTKIALSPGVPCSPSGTL